MALRSVRTFAVRVLRTVLALLTVTSLVVAGLALWLRDDFTREIEAERARVAAGSRVVATACGAVEVAEGGPRPGAAASSGRDRSLPLLVVHGSGGGFDQGLALAEDYAARGWRVIAPSRFGYLRTPWPSDVAPAGSGAAADLGARQADHLACLLDALGVAEVAVMGVSAGAIAATEFAVRHPARIRALVLMVPAGHRPETTPALPGWAQVLLEALVSSDAPFWLASRFAPDTVRRFVLATPPEVYAAATPAERQRADRMMREILPVGARRQGLLHDTLATQAVPRPRLEAIGVPTLAISARDDGFGTLASAAYSARQIPGARLLVFERGGHLLLDRQAEVVAAVEALVEAAAAGPVRAAAPAAAASSGGRATGR